MKSTGFWIGQYLLAAGSMFVLLEVVELAKGGSLAGGWQSAAAWAAISAALFIGARYRQARKNIACALCSDDLEKR